LRVLYVASDQTLPGASGGSVHVHEVARALAKRGHDVHAVVRAEPGRRSRETAFGYTVHRIRWFPFHRFFRFRAKSAVAAIAHDLCPAAVMERYYNFGGEGVLTAAATGVPSLLEVNSPVLDHEGSRKSLVDRALLVRPMRRYRERLCRLATVIITPTAAIVPAFAREKTREITWGANVDLFSPARRDDALRASWRASPGSCVILFSGSHRPWHGVHVLEAAAQRLASRNDIRFVFAGGDSAGPGPSPNTILLGRVPYDDMPRVTASADLSVAPYDRSRLPALRLGFFWSPLKIFEAMASGVPVVTLDIEPLNRIVRDGEEAAFFKENDPEDLARCLAALASDPGKRRAMGDRARARAPRYSWDAHAAELEALLAPAAGGQSGDRPR
jgi:glycosyltransferase involved in cell wall biosynthesis